MAEVVIMPKLGFDMAEGTLVRWVVAEGENIEKGGVLAEIETDKATVEVESSAAGIIHNQLVEEGSTVPIGEPIAVIGESGEEIDLETLVKTAVPAPQEAMAAPEPSAVGSPPPVVTESPVPAVHGDTDGRLPGGVKASPLARRLAAQQQIDLLLLTGTGPGGRIVKKDVETAIGSAIPHPRKPSLTPAQAQTERLPLSKLRAAIGRRMSRAKQEAPHFYLTAEIDAKPIMDLRSEYNSLLPETEKLSVNDFIVKAAALSLRQFPNLNASLDGDHFVRHGEVNIGVAVAVDDGLLTVVVHEADQKDIQQLSTEIREKAERAREGRVRQEDIEGSTFTVSNLGMFDIDHFIAIINPPEAAILAIGSVREIPLLSEGQLYTGKRMKVTLSADHRLTDGAEAARWLQVFRSYLEKPLQLIL